jgi:predicted nucleic acid-binding Zn ribbon protein
MSAWAQWSRPACNTRFRGSLIAAGFSNKGVSYAKSEMRAGTEGET